MLIVPDSHRAAALRLAWARHQMAAGRAVWASPQALTWDAWIASQWRAAVLRGTAPALQVLSASQERALWEEVLLELAGDGFSLAAHTHGLMRAAGRATQSLLALARSAANDEERLLVDALAAVRRLCAERGLVSLRLATAANLGFLADVPAPLVVGQPALTELQRSLQQQCWQDTPLLPQPAAEPATAPVLQRAIDLDAELAACADWCLRKLERAPAARLLVLSAGMDPSLTIQAELLWRQLAGARRDDAQLRRQLLAVEGGEPLQHQALIDDVLAALECAAAEVDTERLFTLLRSPYFDFGSQPDRWALQGWFEQRGIARFPRHVLRDALDAIAGSAAGNAAARFTAWFAQLDVQLDERTRSTSDWAQRFHDSLAAAGFGTAAGLDSRDQQRLARWSELLDEFAALDAVLAPISLAEALQRLQRLAAEGRHQPASGDAAITLSDQLADPVIDYDGIWVLGLAETRWPPPPRPDPYVSLIEQRRSHWPESGVSQRRAQSLWAQSRWQQRTPELVMSYAERDGDLHNRPSALLAALPDSWMEAKPGLLTVPTGLAGPAEDQQFPPLAATTFVKPLAGGVDRLRIQHECAFRAQAQWRLAARPPSALADGITATSRGRLLHSLLQELWGELRDQAALLALTPTTEATLLQRCWERAVVSQYDAGTRWLPVRLLQRERARTLRVVERLLYLERQRAPFSVQDRERALEWPATGARLRLRIDRIDRNAGGERILIDYKSGAADTVKLHEGELEPLQLALYVAALASRGEAVSAALLFGLKPADFGCTGVVANAAFVGSGVRPVEDWEAAAALWRDELLKLLHAHLGGAAPLALARDACRYCHLPALCRRAPQDEDMEAGDD